MFSLNFLIAVASSRVMRGLLRTRSSSAWVRTIGCRWMVKLSAPTSDTIALVTYSFMPWTSDTTAMIEVTATMLPSTVMNERSLFDQIASSAMPAASKNWNILRFRRGGPGRGLDFHRRAVAQLAHRTERPDDHLVA